MKKLKNFNQGHVAISNERETKGKIKVTECKVEKRVTKRPIHRKKKSGLNQKERRSSQILAEWI